MVCGRTDGFACRRGLSLEAERSHPVTCLHQFSEGLGFVRPDKEAKVFF